MANHLKIAVLLTLLYTLLLGLAYPLCVTGIAHVIFPRQANGSLIRVDGTTVGSALIGQQFTRPEYLHPRPSSAGKTGYDPTESGGSNLGPTSKGLISRTAGYVTRVLKENPGLAKGSIPVDMVTSSASGLDPDISPANAYDQVPRIAAARGLSQTLVRELISKNITDREFGILGEQRVNVLKTNIELDKLTGKK